MNILFLSISSAISSLDNRGIYPDLLRCFVNHGHKIFIVCPNERKTRRITEYIEHENVSILKVATLNITKSNFIEKGLATILIQHQFERAIDKYYHRNHFDLILYSTPPITFNKLVKKIKNRHQAKTYLMLKDIFPQNAVDLDILKEGGLLYRYFRKKEEMLYSISDFIGCMSQANVEYVLKHNPKINKSKVVMCPNTIEVKDRTPSKRLSILSKYDINNSKTIFLYGGNLGVPQGVPFLLNILDRIKDRDDLFFLIVGGGSQAHLIKNWILRQTPKNIKYIPMLPKNEYDELESCCDVGMIFLDYRFTIPNFPSRLLTYLECKLPLLISTDSASDIGKIAVEHDFGRWSKSCNVDEFMENINYFITNSSRRKEMGQNGYNYLTKNYNVEESYSLIMNKISE